MKRPFLAAALLLLAASNAWVLVHVALNRSGPPNAELELTSRELFTYGRQSDDSDVSLMLHWQNPAAEYPYANLPGEGVNWFDQNKLVELGFECRVRPESADASRHYQNLRMRQVYVALEYDGEAWQRWLKRRSETIATESSYNQEISLEQRMEIESRTASRLVAVDAGLDPRALRQKYPDRKRVAILAGVARAVLDSHPSRPAFLRGAIVKLAIDSIHVPQPMSHFFDSDPAYVAPWTYSSGNLRIEDPRYAVTLRVGSRYEPWITSLRTLR